MKVMLTDSSEAEVEISRGSATLWVRGPNIFINVNRLQRSAATDLTHIDLRALAALCAAAADEMEQSLPEVAA